MKPTVLIAATSHWLPAARLAGALADAGFSVQAVCSSRHPLQRTTAVYRTYKYRALAPLTSFSRAILSAKPDLIVPGDDLAVQHLFHLYRTMQHSERKAVTIRAAIEHSFGPPESFPIVQARAQFINMAREEGVRVPRTQAISNVADLRKWTSEVGFPCVLKADGTSGGEGVVKVRSLGEAESAFLRLQAPPLLARAAKRAIWDSDKTLLCPSLLRRRSVVNVQTFIEGQEATSLVACWKGRVLASLHFVVIQKTSDAGPATVLRLIDNTDMSVAAEKTARRLNLSGLHGLDYMLEPETGHAYLIEINPRATQVGHLTLGAGRDLPAALYAAVTGRSISPQRKVTENSIFALFPNEWLRDRQSPYLRSAYHDVPWQEPELMKRWVHKAIENNISGSRPAWRRFVKGMAQPIDVPHRNSGRDLAGSVLRCASAEDDGF